MSKCVLVTGGTRGIGKAVVKEFAKNGYDVIINYLQSDDIAIRLKQELETEYNIKIFLVKADLSDETEINNMIQSIMQEFGKIDVLVNNAGIAIDKDFQNKTADDWKQTLNINLIAPFILTKLIGQEMYNQKSGTIINISSTNGIDTYYPTTADYDTSKAGLISLTNNSAMEFAPYVRVNCVAPGWINTEMNKELDKEFVEEEKKKILLKRFGEPEEIAKVVYFLSSDNASYINSSVIRVDGCLR